MAQIITHNSKGERVLVEYTKTVLKEKEQKPEIVINTFDDFVSCVQHYQEEKQYAYGKGDKRYEAAMHKLLIQDHERYTDYVKKLSERFKAR